MNKTKLSSYHGISTTTAGVISM